MFVLDFFFVQQPPDELIRSMQLFLFVVSSVFLSDWRLPRVVRIAFDFNLVKLVFKNGLGNFKRFLCFGIAFEIFDFWTLN